VPFHEGGLGK